MADYLDYNSTDADLTEEEKRRRQQDPTVGEAIGQGWDKFKGKFTDANGDFSMGKYLAGQMAGGGMNQQTAMEKQLMQGAGVPAQPGFITGGAGGQPPAVPVQPQQIPTQYAAGAQPEPTAPASVQPQAPQYTYGRGDGSAASVNNPSGLGARKDASGQYVWRAYDTPEAGVADTQALVSNYLNNPQRNTPESLVGTWVTGDPRQGAQVQNGAYLGAVNRELANAGVKLNADGTIPNIPEANNAITRAIIMHESGPKTAANFLPFVGAGGVVPQERNVAAVGREMGMNEPGYGGGDNVPQQTPDALQAIMRGDAAAVLSNAHATEQDLAKIAYSPDADPLAKKYAKERMISLITAGREIPRAQATIAAADGGDPKAVREVSGALNQRSKESNEGSWLKALLLAKLGLGEAATNEFAKLGVGSTEHEIKIGDKQGIVSMSPSGKIVKGEFADGKQMSAEDLSKANMISNASKNIHQSPTVHTDPQTGRKFVLQTSAGGQPMFVGIDGKGAATPDEIKRLEQQGVGGTRTQAQFDKLTNLRNSTLAAMSKQGYGTGLAILQDQYNKGFIDRDELAQATRDVNNLATQFNIPGAPGVSAPSGTPAPVQPAAPAAPQGQPAPAAQQQAPVQPAAPQVVATPPAAPAVTPVQPAAPATQTPPNMSVPSSAVVTPRRQLALSTEEAQKIETEKRALQNAQTEKRNALAATGQSEYTKEVGDSMKNATSAIAVTDRLIGAIDKNPELWGKLSSSPSWQAYINAQPENQQAAKTKLYNDINIPKEKRGIADQILNDYKTAEVAAVTTSGLTASQTNSEKEGARIVGQIGSIENKAEAAKATLTWRRAQHEYAVAKAKEWDAAVKRDPSITPISFADQFDAPGGTGDKIFATANKKMSDIIYGKKTEGAPAPSEFKVMRSGGFSLKGIE